MTQDKLRKALENLLAVAEMTTFSDQYPAECEAARAALSPSTEQMIADGWIKWEGGECPIADDVRVNIRTRDHSVEFGNLAYNLDWAHLGESVQDGYCDIVAYQVVQP